MCVGDSVGAAVVGAKVGDSVGAAVGDSVDKHRVASLGSATYPSRHSHTHSPPAFTAIVVCKSQPSTLSLHASSVGMCVGAVVGAVVVGAVVGVCDGSTVGATVGAIVDEHRVASVGSATYPSRHSHTHSLPAFTAIVVCKSHPDDPSSHARSVGM